ncbi:G/U mismatch-specific uracil-DNA glycosylase [Pedobacter westerhofensis]|uniref:G/U mismatch-specific uracil-DNA glycosylase n=1 Tax=Pedobacter westerhofensis TaxID=425512 RepID=A0A521EXK7_9SPHI|nr:DNA-deoxyinosine glycosylase [Pedobacter westerhofensis]SMO88141.1 G/U mismatch-specific uracil-DNA glycosylase [Pedobacter westerhofensis]
MNNSDTSPIKTAFQPIVNQQCTVLLLGTMPGDRSLRLQQYYGHAGNHFWKLIYTLFGQPLEPDYESRKLFLLEHHIALWDVLESCTCEGSLDSNIKNEVVNDFAAFYHQYPNIGHVFFDSKKAEEFYLRYVKKSEDKIYHLLPSPSRANASKSFDQKLEAWTELLLYTKE